MDANRQSDAQSSRLISGLALMLTTVMVIMDMTIVNVTLPHMMGALGATADQVTWVLTGYIVSEAVTIPLTGYLAGRFGRRRVLLFGIGGFVLASALCGQSTSLAEIVGFRLLQGIAGAPLIPLSQAVLVDAFAAEERGKAMAIWGIGIMLGPVLGPTVGGFVTEHLNWRWVFYINLPIGLINLMLVARVIQETPRRVVGTDLLGAILMVIGIGSLQTLLDRGNQEGWWQSGFIDLLSLAAVMGIGLFILRSLSVEQPIVDLRLFRDRNLAVASGMMLVFGLGLFGTIAIQPIMLERLFGYPVETTGLVMAPRALGSALSMALMAKLTSRVDHRWLVGSGMLLAALGTSLMARYNLDASPAWMIWPGVVQGLGMGAVFVPLSSMAYTTLRREQADAGAGLFNLARTIGSAVGVSIAATEYTRYTQIDWHQLGSHIQPFNPALHNWLAAQGLTLNHPMAVSRLAQTLSEQASMLAFTQVFELIAMSFLLMAPLLLLLRSSHKH
ncbi:MAG: DHA2 family efflux MFS transporter permease subunit [Candidatus Thiodiazotropha sp.]